MKRQAWEQGKEGGICGNGVEINEKKKKEESLFRKLVKNNERGKGEIEAGIWRKMEKEELIKEGRER